MSTAPDSPPQDGRASRRWSTQVQAWDRVPPSSGDAAASRRAAAHRDVVRAVDRRDPATAMGLEALPRHGTVLDVGCAAGARSVGLAGRARIMTGVDLDEDLLEAYRDRLERPRMKLLGIGSTSVRTVTGPWPGAVDATTTADVVVAGGVVYAVADGIDVFLDALTHHARQRVVLTLPERHPRAWLAPYVEHLHDVPCRQSPRAGLLLDVLRDLGVTPRVVAWDEAADHPTGDRLVHDVAVWAGVGAERHDEVREALWRRPPPSVRTRLAVSWDGVA